MKEYIEFYTVNQKVNQLWELHFQTLEVKTFQQKALEKVLEQIIKVLDERNIQKEDIKGAMWASLLDGMQRAFGLMILFDNKLEFIGAIPNDGRLKTWQWSFQGIEIQKQEDMKLGITKSISLTDHEKTYKWEGLKGFVPSVFVLSLEKYWYKS